MGQAPLPPLQVVGATVADVGALLPQRRGDIKLPNFTACIHLKNKEEALRLLAAESTFTTPHKLFMRILHRRFQPLRKELIAYEMEQEKNGIATAPGGTGAGGTDEQSMDIDSDETAPPQTMGNDWQQNRRRRREGGNNGGRGSNNSGDRGRGHKRHKVPSNLHQII